MTGSILGIPAFDASNGTQRSSARNPYLPVVTADTLSAENLGKDSFYKSGGSQQAESSWWDSAMGMLRSVGESLRLIDPASKNESATGDVFGAP